MEKILLVLLLAILAGCASSPSTKQQMLNDLSDYRHQLKQIEEEIDIPGVPKTEKEFYEQLREDLKSNNSLKV